MCIKGKKEKRKRKRREERRGEKTRYLHSVLVRREIEGRVGEGGRCREGWIVRIAWIEWNGWWLLLAVGKREGTSLPTYLIVEFVCCTACT